LVGVWLSQNDTECIENLDLANSSTVTPGFFVLPASLPITSFQRQGAIDEKRATHREKNDGMKDIIMDSRHPLFHLADLPIERADPLFPLVILGLHSHEQHFSSFYYEAIASGSSVPPEVAIVKECIKAVDSNVVLRLRTRGADEMKLIAVHCEESIKYFHRWAGTTSGYKALIRYQRIQSDRPELGQSRLRRHNEGSCADFPPSRSWSSETPSHINGRQLWYPSFGCSLPDLTGTPTPTAQNAPVPVKMPSASTPSASTVRPLNVPHKHSLKPFPLIDDKRVREQCREQVCEGSEKVCDEAEEFQGDDTAMTFKDKDTLRLCCPNRNETAIEQHCKEYSMKNSRIIWILIFLVGSAFLIALCAIAYREIRDMRRRRKVARVKAKLPLISIDDTHAGIGNATDGCQDEDYGTMARNQWWRKKPAVFPGPGPDPSRLENALKAVIDSRGENPITMRKPWYQRVLALPATRTGRETPVESVGLRRLSRGKRPLPSVAHNQSCPAFPVHARSSSIDLARPASAVQSSRSPLAERETNGMVSENDRYGQGGSSGSKQVSTASPRLMIPSEGMDLENLDQLHEAGVFDGLT